MVDLKHKNLAVSGVKVVDADQGIVEAFVAGIGNRDSQKDIIQPGAFDQGLTERNPKCVWSHDWDTPVGKCLEVREVKAGSDELPVKMKDAGIGGLYTKTQFNLATQRGKDAFSDVVFFGDEQEWSIGYREVKAHWDKDAEANIVEAVALYEYSPVLFGANSATSTVSAKAADLIEEARIEAREADIAALAELAELDEDTLAQLAALGIEPTTAEKDDEEADPEGAPSEEEVIEDTDIVALTGAPVTGEAFAAWRAAKHAAAVAEVEKGTYDDDEARTKAYGVPGSHEAFRAEVMEAVREHDSMDSVEYVSAVATFDDHVVVWWDRPVVELVESGEGYWYPEVTGWENGYVQFDVAVSDGKIEVSNPITVDLVSQIVPTGEPVELADDAPETKGAVMGRIVVEVGADAKTLIESLEANVAKVGRVLSQKNHDRLVEARDALDEVIEAATPAEADDSKAEAVEPPAPIELADDPADEVTLSEEDIASLASLGITVEV